MSTFRIARARATRTAAASTVPSSRISTCPASTVSLRSTGMSAMIPVIGLEMSMTSLGEIMQSKPPVVAALSVAAADANGSRLRSAGGAFSGSELVRAAADGSLPPSGSAVSRNLARPGTNAKPSTMKATVLTAAPMRRLRRSLVSDSSRAFVIYSALPENASSSSKACSDFRRLRLARAFCLSSARWAHFVNQITNNRG